MAVRMFEYDLAIAIDEALKEGSPYCVKFPKSAVFYLRHTSDTPDTLSLNVVFPDNQEFIYQVPVIKVQKFSIDEIAEKHLWLLVPYYIMRYEKQFNKMEQNQSICKDMLADLNIIFAKLGEYAEATNQWNIYTDLLKLTERITDYMLRNHQKVKKEVSGIMGGKLLELHSEKMIKKGKRVGRAEGRAAERKDGIKALISSAKAFAATPAQTVEQLMKNYALTKDEAQAVVQANW